MVAKEGAEAVPKGRQKLEETGRELLRSSTPASSFARVKGSARARLQLRSDAGRGAGGRRFGTEFGCG